MRMNQFILLFITTSESEAVNFTVSSLNQTIANGSVIAGTPTTISDSILISYAVSNESDRYKGILVTTGTEKKISVTVATMEDGPGSAGVYVNYQILAYSVNTCSYVYYAMSIGSKESVLSSFSSLLLVSGSNNTNITITPTVTVTIPSNLTQSGNQTVLNAGQSITIQLQYLETLLLKPVAALADLTGTKVESNKPLSVYSGHTCGHIPTDKDDCDFVGEQIPPVASWGNEFLVQSFYSRHSYILKLIGSQNDTNIDITCADGSHYTLSLQEGSVLNQTISETSCYINSTSPILVAQFVLGYSAHTNFRPGDPAMTIIPPLHQYANNVTSFPIVNLRHDPSYFLSGSFSVNLVVLAVNDSSQIQLNGTVLPSLTSSSWKRYDSSVGGSYVMNSTMLSVESANIVDIVDIGDNSELVEIRVWSNNSDDKILAMVYGLGRLFGFSYTGTSDLRPNEGMCTSCVKFHYVCGGSLCCM